MRKADLENTEQRRRQVLDAALVCFREKGFAGASIADICRQAGMSPGHLYHYFTSKDEIVAAIAEQDRQAVSQAFDRLAERDDLLGAILDALNPEADLGDFAIDGTLAFDIFAETARNPAVASSVRVIYRHINARLARLIIEAQARGLVSNSVDAEGAALAITTVFEGLAVMGAIHGGSDLTRAAPSVRTAIRAILEDPPGDAGQPAPMRTQRRRRSKVSENAS
ncbi:MAG: TetR/AcrR family transcriptional regulator [Rhodospirillales bacterium]|nr:TetR/AcrR family transcriptional regulator [Rhodospirillales bacterium]